MRIETDYVVVGAGSAGCVVASRLSEDASRVVLLEAGSSDRHPLIHVPAGVGHLLYDRRVNWMYASEQEPGANNRNLHCPRGRVLGGSSSINGMLYVRGNAADYDAWAQLGCRGWTYDEVLPHFKHSERYTGGDPSYRGRGGPMPVEDYRTILPLTHHFVRAAQEAGFPFNPDINGGTQDGVGYSQMTRRGRFRGSTAQTFLREARGRQNLRIETNAVATRLLMRGRRCIGVAFRRGGEDHEVHVAREVILSGGSINSPQLLQLSGIGPAAHLQAHGIEVVHDLPGVGGNLVDHYAVRIVHRIRDLVSINELARGVRLAREIARFAVTGRGALTFGVTSAMVFCESREGLASPDLQLLFTPASYVFGKALVLERDPGMTLAICPTRPRSRGSVMLRSPDPLTAPAIRFNYLTDGDDLRVMRAGFRHGRRILDAPAFQPFDVAETRPGREVQTDDEIDAFARQEGASLYHPVGTCKMGIDAQAVVDPRLRVHGIEGLRVADAAIMPFTTTGNTNAPTIMIGEKAAHMIRQDSTGDAQVRVAA